MGTTLELSLKGLTVALMSLCMSDPGGKIIFVETVGLVSRQCGIPRAEEAAPSIRGCLPSAPVACQVLSSFQNFPH